MRERHSQRTVPWSLDVDVLADLSQTKAFWGLELALNDLVYRPGRAVISSN